MKTKPRNRDRQPPGARPAGAGDRDQPRRQGGQGRPPVLVHRAGRRRRRGLRGRDRLRQGPRGPAGDPEGGRERAQEPDPDPEVRADASASHDRPLRLGPRRPAPGQPRYRRDRRWRRARGARARRGPRRAVEVDRHPEPDQPRQGDDGRASPACAGPEDVAKLRGLSVKQVLGLDLQEAAAKARRPPSGARAAAEPAEPSPRPVPPVAAAAEAPAPRPAEAAAAEAPSRRGAHPMAEVAAASRCAPPTAPARSSAARSRR